MCLRLQKTKSAVVQPLNSTPRQVSVLSSSEGLRDPRRLLQPGLNYSRTSLDIREIRVVTASSYAQRRNTQTGFLPCWKRGCRSRSVTEMSPADNGLQSSPHEGRRGEAAASTRGQPDSLRRTADTARVPPPQPCAPTTPSPRSPEPRRQGLAPVPTPEEADSIPAATPGVARVPPTKRRAPPG